MSVMNGLKRDAAAAVPVSVDIIAGRAARIGHSQVRLRHYFFATRMESDNRVHRCLYLISLCVAGAFVDHKKTATSQTEVSNVCTRWCDCIDKTDDIHLQELPSLSALSKTMNEVLQRNMHE